MPNNPVALNNRNRPWGADRAPHTQPGWYGLVLAAEHRGCALSQLHLALVMGRSVTHNLLAGADGPRREYRGCALSQLHLARVMGRRVTHDPLAHNGPPGIHDLTHGPGIHDLTHGMSPVVYESSPSWYPQPKS